MKYFVICFLFFSICAYGQATNSATNITSVKKFTQNTDEHRYIVVAVERDFEKFITTVNSLLEYGYKPQGGISVLMTYTLCYYQAMYREEK